MRTTSLRVTVGLSARAPAHRRAPLAPVDAARIGDMAADALLAELDTWPKPGLVSPLDNGSHSDMDYGTFQRSIAALRPFYGELVAAGAAGAGMDELRRIGVEAEAAMLKATGGVNTHRGAIFALGLLCAAAGAAACEPSPVSSERLARMVGTRWGHEIVRGPIPLNSHGSAALRRFGAGGARAEAAAGFPHARTIGLPMLRAGRALAGEDAATGARLLRTAGGDGRHQPAPPRRRRRPCRRTPRRAGFRRCRRRGPGGLARPRHGGAPPIRDAAPQPRRIRRPAGGDRLPRSHRERAVSGIAILCSGQGSQSPEMFDLIAAEPAAAPVFEAAAAALNGRDPRDIVRQGGDDIHSNDVAQALCCTQALAAWAVIGEAAPRPVTIAGYSAGEVPAWAVAGVFDMKTAFALVARRAALMDEETHEPCGLAAIVGLPRNAVDALCRAHGLAVAIINGPLHFILGGRTAGLQPALPQALARGATRVAMLPIHVASHTPLLEAASERFHGLLTETVAAGIPRDLRLISGIDGMPVRRITEGFAKLAAQVSTSIDWAACMDACRAARPVRVLELGPGNALARMSADLAPGIPARSVADFRTVEGLRRWIEATP